MDITSIQEMPRMLPLFIQCIGMIIPILGFTIMISKAQTKSTTFLLIADMGAFITNAAYLLMIRAQEGEAGIVALKMEMFGVAMFNLFFTLFIISYLRIPIPKILIAFWGLVEAVQILALWSDDSHRRLIKDIQFVEDDFYQINNVQIDMGTLTPIRDGFVATVLFCLVFFAIYRMVKAATHSERHSMMRLMIANIVIVCGQSLSLLGVFSYNVMPLSCSIGLLIIIVSVISGEFYSVTDMGREWAVDNLNEIFVIVDAKFRLLYANKFALAFFRENALKMIKDQDVQQCLLPNKEIPEQIREVIENQKGTIELCGNYYECMVSTLIYGKETVGYSLILMDNTETVNLMKDLEEQRDIANAAVKARSDFMSNMSHEIRTPMNAIVGMTDIILRDQRVPQEDVGYLMNIKNSGKALLAIVNDILDFSKIDAGKMELVEDVYQPMSMLNDIRMIILNRIGSKPIDLVFNIDKNLPAALYGDSLRLRQVIINIANNATKFTDEGKITLNMEIRSEVEDDMEIYFSVQDTGQGIKEEDLGKLFQQFSQVDTTKNHSKEGTGLGLALSKQIVEMMGGTIGVNSVYGEGSEFYFTVHQKRRSDELAGSIDEAYKFTKIVEHVEFEAPEAVVLLVDDNSMNIKVAKGLLEPLHLKIDTAENGQEAVTKAKLSDYDLILMDHMMPIMDGCEATRRIRAFEDEKKANVPIIALTADVVESSRQEFEEVGMNGFVAKPIEFLQICDTIRKWLPQEKIHILEPGSYNKTHAKDEAAKPATGEVKSLQEHTTAEEPAGELSEEEKALENLAQYGFSYSDGVRYSGSRELLLELLGEFYSLIDMKSTKIEKSLADGLIRDYTVEVHALKSTTRMIGIEDLSEEFKHLEALGNAQDVETIEKETPKVLEHYRSFKEPMKFFSKAANTDKRMASTEEIRQYLTAMKDAVDAFDMDMVDESLNKLLECQMPDDCQELLEKLAALVADFAMEEIVSTADEMLSLLN